MNWIFHPLFNISDKMYKKKLILWLVIVFLSFAPQAYGIVRLNYVELTEVTQFDPLLATDLASIRFSTLIYNKLVGVDANLRLKAELLDSLNPESKTREDGRDIYRFKLRKIKDGGKEENIKWVACKTNGMLVVVKDFTVKDIIYTFNRIKYEDNSYDDKRKIFSEAREVPGRDDLVDFVLTYNVSSRSEGVKLELVQKSLRFPILPDLSGYDLSSYAKIRGRNVIGTGYFVVKDAYTNTIVMVKNGYYFDKQPPPRIRGFNYIDEVVMEYYRDSLIAVEDLRSGKIDMIVELPLQYYGTVRASPNIGEPIKHGTNNFSFFAYNCKGNFRDVRLRQAFTHAVDRVEMFVNAYGEIYPGLQGKPIKEIKEILHSPLPYSETPIDITPLEYNVAKAKQLKTQSGFNADKVTLLTYKGEVDEDRICKDFIKYIGDNLGIKVEELSVTKPEWRRRFDKGDFDIAFGRWTFQEDTNIIQYLFSNTSKNVISYENSEIERLLNDFEISGSPEKRLGIRYEMSKILANEVPYTFLFQLPKYAAFNSKKLENVILHPYEFFNFINYWLVAEE